MTEPSKELIDDLDRRRVERAREMDPGEKFFAGPRLFDQVCRVMIDGIRDEFPDAGPQRIQEILRQRLALARRLEQDG